MSCGNKEKKDAGNEVDGEEEDGDDEEENDDDEAKNDDDDDDDKIEKKTQNSKKKKNKKTQNSKKKEKKKNKQIDALSDKLALSKVQLDALNSSSTTVDDSEIFEALQRYASR